MCSAGAWGFLLSNLPQPRLISICLYEVLLGRGASRLPLLPTGPTHLFYLLALLPPESSRSFQAAQAPFCSAPSGLIHILALDRSFPFHQKLVVLSSPSVARVSLHCRITCCVSLCASGSSRTIRDSQFLAVFSFRECPEPTGNFRPHSRWPRWGRSLGMGAAHRLESLLGVP